MLTLAAKTAAMTRLRLSSQLRHASPGAGHKRRRNMFHVLHTRRTSATDM
jgi:hypothetical protein